MTCKVSSDNSKRWLGLAARGPAGAQVCTAQGDTSLRGLGHVAGSVRALGHAPAPGLILTRHAMQRSSTLSSHQLLLPPPGRTHSPTPRWAPAFPRAALPHPDLRVA